MCEDGRQMMIYLFVGSVELATYITIFDVLTDEKQDIKGPSSDLRAPLLCLSVRHTREQRMKKTRV